MKKILLLLVACIAVSSLYAQGTPPAKSVIEAAYRKAAAENKNVMVIFHASWCIWCRKMDTAMSDPLVRDFFDRSFVVEHLTVNESKGKEHNEHPGAEAILEKHGGKDQGIPFWIVFDPKGKALASALMPSGKNSGCPASKEEVDHFINVLQKTTSLDDTALEAIRIRFLKNSL